MEKSKRNEVLLVLPEAPQALRESGISIRYIPLIESIYKDCILDILIISKETYSIENDSILRTYCRNIYTISHPASNEISWSNKLFTRLTFILPWSLPRSWVAYGADAIKLKIRDITRNIYYKTTICVSGYNYPYLGAINSEKIIIDFIDSPSVLSWRNVIGSKRPVIVRLYETFKTVWWEAKIIRQTDASLYISSSDVMVIPSFMAPTNKRHVIRNGYSADDYVNTTIESINHPSIGFLGNMSYYPNVESILWLKNNVFTEIRKRYPDISLYVIGRNPVASVKELEKIPGITVTGDVDSIWSYLNSVDIMVFPLMRGAGVKNKIIEAMYANKLVLTTDIGNEGIDAAKSNALVICNTRSEYIENISHYIACEEERLNIALNGRKFVIENFSWNSIMIKFSDIVLN